MKVQKGNMELALNQKTRAYEIRCHGVTWVSQGRKPYVLLRRKAGKRYVYAYHTLGAAKEKRFRVEDSKIIASYSGFSAFGKKLSFTLVCTAEITEETEVVFRVRAHGEEGMDIHAVYFPSAFNTSEPKEPSHAVDTMRQGLLMPDHYKKNWLSKFIMTKYWRNINTGDCYSPYWGRVCGTDGCTAIVETPYDASMFSSFGKHGSFLNSVHWRSSLGKLAYERSIRFRFAQNCDYNTIAKTYRAYLKETNQLVSIDEKIAQNPNVAYLIGAPVLHQKIYQNIHPKSKYYKKGGENQKRFATFYERAQQLETMHKLGLEKLYIHTDGWGVAGYDNQHPNILPPCEKAGGYEGMKALSETCDKLDYRFGVHDQYRDYYYDSASYEAEKAVQNIDGGHPYCEIWDGGPHTWLCAGFAPPLVKRTYETLEAHGIHVRGSYLDVFSIVAGDECFDKAHRKTRQESMMHRGACLEYLRKKGIIASSEEAGSLLLNQLDLVHHAPYAVRPQGGGAAVGIPVPLSNLVYHDCLFVPWICTGTGGWGIPNGESGRLHCILNAQTPYFVPFEKETNLVGEQQLVQEIQNVQEVAKINQMLYNQEMVSHRFLDDTLRKQQTTYSDGTVITVDFDNNTYQIRTHQ